MSIRNAAKQLIPPILLWPLTKRRAGKRPSSSASLAPDLFDNEANFLLSEISNCTHYGEYGTGASTQYVLRSTDATVTCVDSDEAWLTAATRGDFDPERLQAKYVDIGPTIAWGVPIGAANIASFQEYTDWLWIHDNQPDLVLIDGRFRVCCLLTTLLHAKPGCRIIFDDYNNRPQYSFVEKFVKPKKRIGRQAFFEVPDTQYFDRATLELSIDAFRCNLN
ncbi:MULTISPECIES: hypothetical protein [unclassified Roseitalea]|uniref:hypothetical protein n=1 Tax=unclassified Roseitalea TaxID=2639107 RepID=UPI00273EF2D9|nr:MULTISPECIES: hypothetical protein [unclassified Roseitalea]